MVRYFDPRKLVLDQQEEEKKKVEDVLLTQERLDLIKEKEEAALRKKSNIREGLKAADKAVREFKFLKEAWGNELKKGHSVQIHDHFDYHGILYLTKGSPLIVPELNLTILPEPGDYYFFPPNIKHYVPEVQTDETRYSVVFNIALKLDWDKKKRLNLNNEVS